MTTSSSTPWFTIAGVAGGFLCLSVLGFACNAAGLLGGTIIEREVYENSYQYTEARKSEIMQYEAQLAEIDTQLSDPSTLEATKSNLRKQRASINVRLTGARDKKSQASLQQ